MSAELGGFAAALHTPRREDGSIDLEALVRNADWVISQGASGVVPCGGTGEYSDLTLAQRKEIVKQLAWVPKVKAKLVVGVGSGSLRDSVGLAHHALHTGADAVLLPPPHFYRYGASDLLPFFRAAARAIGGPTMLYNLAGFVSPLDADLVAELIGTETHVIGIKDSSGGLEILRRLSQAGTPCVRVQGHDAWLAESLRQGLADAAISGPASVVPEAMQAVFETCGNEDAFSAAAAHLEQFLQQLLRFPYPWAIKWAAQYRGLDPVTFPIPLSAERDQDRQAFMSWFEKWLENGPPPGPDFRRP